MASEEKGSETEVVTVDIEEAKRLVDSGYTYLDVRSVELYKKGHVDAEKIHNIPYMFTTPEGRVKNPDFLKEVSAVFKKEDRLVVGCYSGGRSISAATDLFAAGFKEVRNVGEGYQAWVQNGFPMKTEEEQKVEL